MDTDSDSVILERTEIHKPSSTFTLAFCFRAFSERQLRKTESKQNRDFARWEREKIRVSAVYRGWSLQVRDSRGTCTKKELQESAKESKWLVRLVVERIQEDTA